MPRDGTGVYSLATNTEAVSGETISSTKFNQLTQDLEADANAARPVASGGTGAASSADARVNLGLELGVDVQPYHANLASISGLSPSNGAFIVGDGSSFVIQDAATALGSLGVSAFGRSFLDDANAAAGRATLELGSAATQDANAFARPAIRKTSGSTHATSANSWTLLFSGRVMTGVFLDASNAVTTVHSHILQIERPDGVWLTLAEA